MRNADDPNLLGVAEAITDGLPVDWQAVMAAHADRKRQVEQLHALEAVAEAHRRILGPEACGPQDSPSRETTQVVGPSEETTPQPGFTGPAVALGKWGPLRIRERIGTGGFGEVFRAYDPSLERDVALKLRRADRAGTDPFSGRFLQEARRLARVRHPNVLVVHGADEHEGRAGLWTDLLRGKTLEELLADQGPFGALEAALVGIDLCHALAAVHAAGLIHRDVKTSNVMREEGGRIVLMDFGSVGERPAAVEAGGDRLTGTPLFMAPEVLRGEAPGPASDIYSLGVLLYRLVSRRFPLEAGTWSELRDRHQCGESVPLRDARSDLPTNFVQVIERALAPDPERRFPSAGSMEAALAALLSSLSPSGVIPINQSRWRRAATDIAVAAGLIVLAAVAALTLPSLLWPGPFNVRAELYRQGAGAQERLLSGGRLHVGDRLFMEAEASEAMHLYVLNEDERGDTFVLFPLSDLDLANPLSPKVRHRLPGPMRGIQQYWKVTSAGGSETYYVIASRRPLDDLQREIENFRRAEAGRQVEDVQRRPPGKPRGTGGLEGEDVSGESGAGRRLSGLVHELASRAEARRDLLIQQIRLDNPGP